MSRARLARVIAALCATLGPVVTSAQVPWDAGKRALGNATVGKLEKEINQRLLQESRKNQCSFKTDSDELDKGCDPKAKRLPLRGR